MGRSVGVRLIDLRGGTVRLATEADGTPHLELTGIETVRRTTGL